MATLNRDKSLVRYLRIDRSKIDVAKRTVEMVASTEEPVERWGEQEVLSHDPDNVNLKRLNSGNHPLLAGHDEHDLDSNVGVIERAWLDKNQLRCLARFSKRPKAEEVWQDVQDGILGNVSVGYDRDSIVSSTKSDDGMVTTKYRWTPYHVGIVNVPADTKAGMMRNHSDDSTLNLNVEEITQQLTPAQRQQMLKNLLLDPAKPDQQTGAPSAPAAESQPTRAQIVKELSERRKQIREIGNALISKKAHVREVVTAVMDEADNEPSMTVEQFRLKMYEKAQDVPEPKPLTMAARGVKAKDREGFNIMRGIQSMAKNNYARAPKDGIEREWHDEMTKELGGNVDFGGWIIPFDAPVRNGKGISLCRDDNSEDARMARDLTVGTFGQGGAFVATLIEVPIIEVLRNKEVLGRRGITMLNGLNSNLAIPRQTAAGTAYSLAEQGLVTVSNQAIDQIALTPHAVRFQGRYSHQLLIQSSVDTQSFVRDDGLKVLGLKCDYLGMFGGGNADEPTGIFNQPGISSVTFGGAPSFATCVSMETALAALNADEGPMAYVTSALSRGILKSQAKVLTGATQVVQIAIWEGQDAEGEGMINGHVAASSNQMLNNIMAFADWSSCVQGNFGGLGIILDPYTQAGAGTDVLTMELFIDFTLRHSQSVCASTDSAAQ